MEDSSGGPPAAKDVAMASLAPQPAPRKTTPPDPTVAEQFGDLVRFVYTNNPFYVISAALVFWGLRSSFDTTGQSFETHALLIGLIGYTLLLAATAGFLIRVGQVWDDVRTLLLLVVLMLLAISVSFDDALAANPAVGAWYFVGGLAFAIAVSEGLLRVLRLTLPAMFRVPYYLTLAMFFLYPVAISPWLDQPGDPALYWALAAFLAPGRTGFTDVAAGDLAGTSLRPQEREPLALAVVPLGIVRNAGNRRLRAELLSVLFISFCRRNGDDFRSLFSLAVLACRQPALAGDWSAVATTESD